MEFVLNICGIHIYIHPCIYIHIWMHFISDRTKLILVAISLSTSFFHFIAQQLRSQFAIQSFQVLMYRLLLFIFDEKDLQDWKETYIIVGLLTVSDSVYQKFPSRWNYQACKWDIQHFLFGYGCFKEKIHPKHMRTERNFVLLIWWKLANVTLLPRSVLDMTYLQLVNVILWLTTFFTVQTFPLFASSRKMNKRHSSTEFIDLSLDK